MVVIMVRHDRTQWHAQAESATVSCVGLVGRLFVRIWVGGIVSDL
jgi:hypothetical protein